jgi:Uma2 family endonuclease
MGQAAEIVKMSPEEFLEWETLQEERYEFVDGEVYCHAGARKSHNLVAGDIFGELRTFLKGSPCKAFIADMKLRIESANAFFYPDVMVSCDERDTKADMALEHPTLIIEVLSDSTAAYDLGKKFEYYRLIPELLEYVVVEPDRKHIYLYRRNGGGEWLFRDIRSGEPLTLSSIGCSIAWNDIFEGVAVPEET